MKDDKQQQLLLFTLNKCLLDPKWFFGKELKFPAVGFFCVNEKGIYELETSPS